MSEINHSIWTYSHTNISVINIHHSFEYNDSQDTTRDGAWSIFLHLKKLASATALPSFMVREIRCQTYGRLPISTSTCWLSMFSSSLWDVVFVLDPQQRNPHMDSKHSTVYLITIQNVPVLVWIRDFFFFFPVIEVPLVHMICLWGSLHLIKWASPSLWGLPIKVESKGNSMFSADSDWW